MLPADRRACLRIETTFRNGSRTVAEKRLMARRRTEDDHARRRRSDAGERMHRSARREGEVPGSELLHVSVAPELEHPLDNLKRLVLPDMTVSRRPGTRGGRDTIDGHGAVALSAIEEDLHVNAEHGQQFRNSRTRGKRIGHGSVHMINQSV